MIPGLTSIRGVAAWWVVIHHYFTMLLNGTPLLLRHVAQYGFLGVDLFFVLSGYVIALNYAPSLARPTVRNYARFLWFRLARIYPLHLVMLLLYALFAVASYFAARRGLPPHRFEFSHFLMHLALVQNWGFANYAEWNAPAWSISVELLAYLLFPAMIWLACRVANYRALYWILALGALAVLGILTPDHPMSDLKYYIVKFGWVRGLLEFWAGLCLFYVRDTGPSAAGLRPALGLAFAAACILAWVAFGVPYYWTMPASFLFLVWALSFPTGALARIMSGRVILYLGTISYSTYMVHMYVVDCASAFLRPGPKPIYFLPLCLALTLFLSALLYRFVELPGRRLLRRIDPTRMWPYQARIDPGLSTVR